MSVVTVKGNYSTSKGTKTINGTKCTTCVKMESATEITITLKASTSVSFCFDTASKKFKINGTSYTTGTKGVYTKTLSAGTYKITKADSINLFGIVFGTSATVSSLDIDFEDAETAIESIADAQQNAMPCGPVFDLTGKVVKSPVPGQLYIQGGKKFIAQ